MKKFFIFLSVLVAGNISAMDISTITRGFSRLESVQPFRDIKEKYGYRPAYLLEVESKKFWGMSRDGGGVAYYDLSQGGGVQGWPLIPWPHDQQPMEILERAAEHVVDVGGLTGAKYPLGCYGNTPLNYGDIDGDGTKELIIFMGNTLVLFSPQYGRTIFSTWMSLGDWFHADDGKFYFEGEYGENIKKPEDPQYESRLIHRRGPENIHAPGYRGYSKIYIGDFDKDGNADILVWRKNYISKLESDAERGFTLIRNEWNHYERDLVAQKASQAGATSEYLPQETPTETIQGWLVSNNLTWQKGYPDKSECAGEEGKPILEMSDPLLNDPEVLQ